MPTDKNRLCVPFELVIELHEEIISASGGRHGILNKSALLSALSRPYSGYYNGLDDEISALIESVVQNHGFVDGNKRTAAMLALMMIYARLHELIPIDENDNVDEGLEDLVVDLAAGKIDREYVREWFRIRLRNMHPLQSPATPL